ncbi:PLxRFG domain-containing protein [Thiothrix winogradskyi]|uniref:PLxRFG domain-containing protein n=1 Tax=Thiothrix winogradskyi TaxID=96472 RepID=A0ABY3T4V8_9GAMM|nr:PLxRFG domain-containing protein [Thiothrix winogradskyi]UJS26292.1 PLxRFG domain-containing protein [Thiothrix winogradskyi]
MSNVFDQFDEKPAAKAQQQPAPANVFDQFDAPVAVGGSDFWRGLENYMPQTKQTLGYAAGIAGEGLRRAGLDETGSEFRDYGLGVADEKAKVIQGNSKASDRFSGIRSAGDLVDWVQYNAGQAVGNLGESLAVAGAGALVGSVAPGAGTLAGAATGLLGKQATKTVIKEAGEKIAASMARDAVKKRAGTGATTALAASALTHGLGETTGNVVRDGRELEDLSGTQYAKVLAGGAVAGGLEFVADKVGLDAVLGRSGVAGNVVQRAAAGAKNVAAKEAVTELGQSVATRAGAELPLGDREAWLEYLDSTTAGGLQGGVIGGALGAARSGGGNPPGQAVPPVDAWSADVARVPPVADAQAQPQQNPPAAKPSGGLSGKIIETANALGMNPVDLATIISYETAGTFDPTKRGPTTQWGQHRGLIQFGEPQAKEFGVDWNDPIGSQLGENGAVVKYFRKHGWQPGMNLTNAYSIVNAGAPNKFNATDENNGGARGTVAEKVRDQFAPHRRKAEKLLGGEIDVTVPRSDGEPVGEQAARDPDLWNSAESAMDAAGQQRDTGDAGLWNSSADRIMDEQAARDAELWNPVENSGDAFAPSHVLADGREVMELPDEATGESVWVDRDLNEVEPVALGQATALPEKPVSPVVDVAVGQSGVVDNVEAGEVVAENATVVDGAGQAAALAEAAPPARGVGESAVERLGADAGAVLPSATGLDAQGLPFEPQSPDVVAGVNGEHIPTVMPQGADGGQGVELGGILAGGLPDNGGKVEPGVGGAEALARAVRGDQVVDAGKVMGGRGQAAARGVDAVAPQSVGQDAPVDFVGGGVADFGNPALPSNDRQMESPVVPAAGQVDKPQYDGLFSVTEDASNSAQGGTVAAVRAELVAKLGKRLALLERSGKLVLSDSPPRDGAQGSFLNGVVTLYPQNIQPGNAWGVFLHEAGEHANLAAMLKDKYAVVVAQFNRLLESGNAYALRADSRQKAAQTAANDVDSERLAYLVEDVTNNPNQQGYGAARLLAARVVAAVRAWAFATFTGKLAWVAPQNLTPADIQALAVRAARSWADGSATLSHSPVSEGRKLMVARNDAKIELEPAMIGNPLGSLNNHPDYQAAKQGDSAAASRVARDLVTDKMIADIQRLGDVLVMPVLAEESQGRNKIPLAVALEIERRTGNTVVLEVIQSKKVGRTELSGLDRIFNVPEFDGQIAENAKYLLVDDTLTQGGTFAALASHIQQSGGVVAGSVALTGKQFSATLKPSDEILSKLRTNYGDIENAFREATGYGFAALTQSEARYLANFTPVESVRSRILAERDAAISRRNSGAATGGVDRQNNQPVDDQAPPREGLGRSGAGESGVKFSVADPNPKWSPDAAVWDGVDLPDDKVGMKRARELVDKSLAWSANQASEVVKNGFAGMLTLRQLVEVGVENGVASMQQYLRRLDEMQTARSAMLAESAELAQDWNALPRQVKVALSHVMHEATRLGVDPSLPKYEPLKASVLGGVDRIREDLGVAGVSVTQAQRRVAVEVAATPEVVELARKLKVARQMRVRKLATSNASADTFQLAQDAAERAATDWRNLKNALLESEKRKVHYPELARKFGNLPDAAKAIFTGARDQYEARFERAQLAIEANVAKAEMGESQKAALLRKLRADFESARLNGIYFPLHRAGRYFVSGKRKRTDLVGGVTTYMKSASPIDTVTDPTTGGVRWQIRGDGRYFASEAEAKFDAGTWATEAQAKASANSRADLIGKPLVAVQVDVPGGGKAWVLQDDPNERVFSMVDSEKEALTLKKEWTDRGFENVDFGVRSEKKTQDDLAEMSAFMGLMKTMEATGQKVDDDVYQAMLRLLPDMSMRKSHIHRKGTAGYSEDALNAFAHSMMHQAHQIAKLEARDDLVAILKEIETESRSVPEANRALAGNLREEMKLRHDWVMTPTSSAFATGMSAFGFFMYLGVSPAAALINTTQTAVVAYPVLGAEFGFDVAGKELLRATGQLSAKGSWTDGQSAIRDEALSADEAAAMADLQKMGLVDRSQALALAGLGDTDNLQNSVTYQKWMGKVGHLFQRAEVVNREVTALAAYRLARQAGKPHDVAVLMAFDLTVTSHFDYSNANRARIMQAPHMKVLLMFKSYSQHMLFYLLKNARDWGKGDVKARGRLLGLLGVTFVLGGVSALPLGFTGLALGAMVAGGKFSAGKQVQGYVIMAALAVLAAAMWGDDEDWTEEMRQAVLEYGGEDMEALLFRGAVNAGLGIDLSSRIGIGELLVRSPDRELEGKDLALHYLEQAAGPGIGYFLGLPVAGALWADGHGDRAAEKVVPKFVRDPLAALRWASEGVLGLNGDPVVENLNAWELFWKANGFTPDAVTQQYELIGYDKRQESRTAKSRQRVLNQYWLASLHGDVEGMSEAMEAAMAWNIDHPLEKPIDGKTLARSLKARANHRAKVAAERGL